MYENRKKELRKDAAQASYETCKTGGGCSSKDMTVEEDLLLSLVNKKTIGGMNPLLDSDCDVLGDMDSQETILITGNSDDEDPDWGDFKVSHLHTSLNKKLDPFKGTDDEPNGTEQQEAIKAFQENNKRDGTPICSKEYTKKPRIDVEKEQTSWHGRRRPVASNLHSSYISKQYAELSSLKIELTTLEVAAIRRKAQMQEELHAPQVEAARIKVAIKKATLAKLI